MANAIALSFLCNGRKRRWCKCEARSIVTVRSETPCIPLLTSLLNRPELRGAESLHARLNNANYSVEAYDELESTRENRPRVSIIGTRGHELEPLAWIRRNKQNYPSRGQVLFLKSKLSIERPITAYPHLESDNFADAWPSAVFEVSWFGKCPLAYCMAGYTCIFVYALMPQSRSFQPTNRIILDERTSSITASMR